MEYTITLLDNLCVNSLVELKYLMRKDYRDGLTLETLMEVDEDGFQVDFTNIDNLNFDNSGNYFEDKVKSKYQIENIISDILLGRPIKPVVIDTRGNVLDGQHRCCAFKVLGIKDIPIFKSMMNDIYYDNLSTRRIRLNIPFEKDFYKEEDLENFKIKCFMETKKEKKTKKQSLKL